MNLQILLLTLLILYILHQNVTFENFELCKEDTKVYISCKN